MAEHCLLRVWGHWHTRKLLGWEFGGKVSRPAGWPAACSFISVISYIIRNSSHLSKSARACTYCIVLAACSGDAQQYQVTPQQCLHDSAMLTSLSNGYKTQQCLQDSAMLTRLSNALNTEQCYELRARFVRLCEICPTLRDLSDLRIAICRNAMLRLSRSKKCVTFATIKTEIATMKKMMFWQ